MEAIWMEDKVSPPSDEQWDWLRRAEQHILYLMKSHYAGVTLNHSVDDLTHAQQMIDDQVVKRTDVLEQQCLGVVLGNVFAATTMYRWAEVTNEYGTMLALCCTESGLTLYPLTMISKRMEDRREVDLPQLYSSLAEIRGG
jgi:hypothetical protein